MIENPWLILSQGLITALVTSIFIVGPLVVAGVVYVFGYLFFELDKDGSQ